MYSNKTDSDAICPGIVSIIPILILLAFHVWADTEHGAKPSYCTLNIFHQPATEEDHVPNGIGYISSDGHRFSCRKVTSEAFHM